MAAELRLANTSITTLDPSLTKDVLYERLVDILNKNEIDEIGILPFLPQAEESTGGNDVYPFIVQERGTKLGIPIFCWVPLLDASYAALKDACKISRPHLASEATPDLSKWWTDPERCRKVRESTSCLMILCPDSFTAMNARKRLVLLGQLDPEKEIQFLNMILTFPRNCKSSGPWHHRKWLLSHIFKDHETIPLDPAVVEEHLKACHLAAERYPKCYYAWSMRHWLIEHLGRHWWAASLESRCDTTTDRVRLQPLMEEFKRMRTHMERNISDHSTLQHFQQCMIQLSGKWIVQRKESFVRNEQQSIELNGPKEIVLQWTRPELAARRKRRDDWYISHETQAIGTSTSVYKSAIKSAVPISITEDENGDIDIDADEITWASFPWVVKLWISELRRARSLIETYPGHESLWYHLRFIHYGLRWLDCEMDFGDTQHVSLAKQQVEELHNLFVSLVTENAYVDQLLLHEKTETSVSIDDEGQKQGQLADKYLTWVGQL
ncbi:Protein prenyltransferase alpha subunit repeat-containing protein 1 [Entomortierella chlamydospora]|nr:Protein prenyltransferase alpha subunit repeat-containing protein 1 [Entomortierella chlamydospora]